DSAACEKRDKSDLTDATQLEVDPEENCTEGSLGEKCEVTVHLVALACAGGTSGAGTVSLVRGIHPSDREKARKSAWDKVTPQAVAPLLITFGASWCKPCNEGLPRLKALTKKHSELRLVLIDVESDAQAAQEWAEKLGLEGPAILDKFDQVAKTYGVVEGEKK